MPKNVFWGIYPKTTRKLLKAYAETAQINLSIANMCMDADNQQYSVYEEKLAESEKIENPTR